MRMILAAILALVAGAVPAAASAGVTPLHGQEFTGLASWYGPGLRGKPTASGETFNPKALTAAHPTLPFGTLVEVSRVNRKKSVVVVITDRGPFVAGRAIDLSRAAARRLHMSYLGTAEVRIQVIGMVE
ncbi:septal ring lytic transglycosylase RlpA family protein [Magnetospirillum sp. SS-4]|uniref:septal ring lytic transglycosylase RlpA family protein n=1 Tax=Magnetospirillum sp. SS-4 TaxID=2681465 RepID=UPI00137E9B63|nr:septal ring lytic transglycosylase RlpA family protein [Magnetospirillum sp. SS-4]CAA7615933.1 Rare lipoprotein A [Magnetospirillum sp. SS-4]